MIKGKSYLSILNQSKISSKYPVKARQNKHLAIVQISFNKKIIEINLVNFQMQILVS
jgi:hypothetical protein